MKVKVYNVIKQKNSTALIDVDVTTELRTFVRTHYKRKRCTKKLISRFVNEGVTNYVKRFGLCKK